MAKFIVNAGGATHSVTDEHRERLAGYRDATYEEIAAWHARQGLPVPQEFQPAAGTNSLPASKASPAVK